MALRDSIRQHRFMSADFARLHAEVLRGGMQPDDNRLSTPPGALEASDVVDLCGEAHLRGERQARGLEALANGRVAIAVLNGGMAMRFGGGAKGTVPLLEGRDDTFLSTKLHQISRLARQVDAVVPTVVMHSFATQAPSSEHLEAIGWIEIPSEARREVAQSIMPRLHADGRVLQEDPTLDALPDSSIYSAPGHGDFLQTMRASGTTEWLSERGVEHVLMSNVDNLGASLTPEVLGAHLEAVERGARVSVEAVERTSTDKGGCIARVGERPAIVEGFRLPATVDMSRYSLFNTNTLWFTLDALRETVPLDWFAVHRTITGTAGETLPIIQFEQLVGQITEFVPSCFLRVDRASRFVPIKTRDDLRAKSAAIASIVATAKSR